MKRPRRFLKRRRRRLQWRGASIPRLATGRSPTREGAGASSFGGEAQGWLGRTSKILRGERQARDSRRGASKNSVLSLARFGPCERRARERISRLRLPPRRLAHPQPAGRESPPSPPTAPSPQRRRRRGGRHPAELGQQFFIGRIGAGRAAHRGGGAMIFVELVEDAQQPVDGAKIARRHLFGGEPQRWIEPGNLQKRMIAARVDRAPGHDFRDDLADGRARATGPPPGRSPRRTSLPATGRKSVSGGRRGLAPSPGALQEAKREQLRSTAQVLVGKAAVYTMNSAFQKVLVNEYGRAHPAPTPVRNSNGLRLTRSQPLSGDRRLLAVRLARRPGHWRRLARLVVPGEFLRDIPMPVRLPVRTAVLFP